MYNIDNSVQLREILGKSVGSTIQSEEFFDFIKTENSCWPNLMFNLKAQLNEIEELIIHIKHGIENNRLPHYFVTDEIDQGGEILTELNNRDLKIGHWSIMEHNLRNLSPLLNCAQWEIKRVKTLEELANWMRICETELMKDKMDERMFQRNLLNEDILLFLGYWEGIPVATSLIYFRHEDSGLYFIAADSKYRKRGFGKAITLHALHQAKQRNSPIMYLEATDSGLPVYKGLGFKDFGPVQLINFAKKANEV